MSNATFMRKVTTMSDDKLLSQDYFPARTVRAAQKAGVSEAFDQIAALFAPTCQYWFAHEIDQHLYLESAEIFGQALGRDSCELQPGDFILLQALVQEMELAKPLHIEGNQSIHVPTNYIYQGLIRGWEQADCVAADMEVSLADIQHQIETTLGRT